MQFIAAAIRGLRQYDGWSGISQGTASRAAASKPAPMQGPPTSKELQYPEMDPS